MADCGLRGNIPDEIFHHTNLTDLELSDNPMLSGQLPESIGNLQYLSLLALSNCSFYGDFPRSIINLTRLEDLELGSNYFNGTLNLDIIQHNQKLAVLDLSNNNLSIVEGKNHNSLFYASFPQFYYISMASCNLKKFPSFLSYQKQIGGLNLSNNQIDGVIPNWLHSQTGIVFLDLSHNFLTKIEGDADLTSLSGLKFLDIHSNRISGPVPLLPQGIVYVDFSSNHFFSLPTYFVSSYRYLSVSNNGLKGEIPLSICNQTSPEFYGSSIPQVLDLSYNNLSGRMPPCLLEDAEFREVLNLRGNKLSGSLPLNISQRCKLRTIDLSENKINGSLPQSLVNCNTLEILDLGNNQIVDRFPIWLGNLENLRVLVLRSNQLYGTIPNREAKTKTNNSFFPTIKVLDLSSNHFRGIIPKIVFQNLKAMVSTSNSTTFKVGDSAYYYQNSITVIWKGLEMEMKETLSIFSSLDLSKNSFSGEIPEEIGQLKSLDVLNLSHNALTGSIPLEFAKLQQLQSLDLSCNKLSGPIPQELTSLHFLSALNLSFNNLVGEIPQVPQLSTFPNASYLGNPRLCGSPLSVQCATTPSNDGSNKSLSSKSSTDIIELSVSIGLGLGVGFASVIWVLISWENEREWFNFIVDMFYFQHIMWIVLHSRLAIGRE
ncbi:receptor-like protein 7 [Carex rostrata]